MRSCAFAVTRIVAGCSLELTRFGGHLMLVKTGVWGIGVSFQSAPCDVPAPSLEQTKTIAEQAYVYGFPMIAAYKVPTDIFSRQLRDSF